MSLYLKDTYISSYFNYIISSYIREYDIQKANISILYKYGILSEEEYNMYYNMDKLKRQISIGYLLKNNPNASKVLTEGFKESRKLFFENNNIQDINVLSIKKDAIFLINTIPNITEFGLITFVNKGIYTSYYRLTKTIEIYYYLDSINNIENLEVKGISDITPHEPYMIDFLKYLFELAETNTIDIVVSTISNFYREYISLNLDVGYYREFNPLSKFNIKSKSITSFYADMVSNNDKQYLDISCNRIILETLYSYYTSAYFSITKR